MAWDTAVPAGTDAIASGDDVIRELKTDIQAALRGQTTDGLIGSFPGASAASPIFAYRGAIGTTAARPAASADVGLYHNTTLNTIQRCSGAAYVDVATLIPSGTQMAFYQASPPTGWTAVAVNDMFLRVVTAGGTGGSTGGSGLAPSSTITLAHTHTVDSHTHDLANHTHTGPSHTHSVPHTGYGWTSDTGVAGTMQTAPTGGTYDQATQGATSGAEGTGATGAPSVNTSSAATPATDSKLANIAFQYADLCLGTKD